MCRVTVWRQVGIPTRNPVSCRKWQKGNLGPERHNYRELVLQVLGWMQGWQPGSLKKSLLGNPTKKWKLEEIWQNLLRKAMAPKNAVLLMTISMYRSHIILILCWSYFICGSWLYCQHFRNPCCFHVEGEMTTQCPSVYICHLCTEW